MRTTATIRSQLSAKQVMPDSHFTYMYYIFVIVGGFTFRTVTVHVLVIRNETTANWFFFVNNDQLASVSLLINLSGSTLQHYLVCSLSVEVL